MKQLEDFKKRVTEIQSRQPWWTVCVYALVIIAVVLLVFHEWFFNDAILTKGDWYYYTKASLVAFREQYFNMWLSDKNFGRVLLDAGQAPTYFLYGLLAKWPGFSYQTSERIVHMIPSVFFAPLGAYLYLRLFTQKLWAIAAGTAVYCCNTYFLQLLTGDITLATAYALAPLMLSAYIKYFRNPSLNRAIVAALASALMSWYEPRVLYVGMLAVALYFPWFIFGKNDVPIRSIKQKILIFSLPLFLFGLMSMFWLLGLLATGGASDQTILSRSLFGAALFKLQNAFALAQPFWTGNAPVSFVYHNISLNQWVIPIGGLIGLYIGRHRLSTFYFALLVLVGLLLGKQQNSPLPALYPWLYNHIPGFDAFREGTKFYLLIALGFSALVALFIDAAITNWRSRRLGILAAAVVIGALASNLLPFATGTIDTTVTARHLPTDYTTWNNFIEHDASTSRVLWMPIASRWADDLVNHSIVNAVDLAHANWQEILLAPGDSNAAAPSSIQQSIAGFYKTALAQTMVDDANIKYIVVPLRDIANEDDFFTDYGDDRQFYLQTLGTIPWLRHINVGTSQIAVFENDSYKPYISSVGRIIQLASLTDLQDVYTFTSGQLHQDFQFAVAHGTAIPHASDFEALFNEPAPSMVSPGMITQTLSNSTGSMLYANANRPDITYAVDRGHISLAAKYNTTVSVNGKISLVDQRDQTLGSQALRDNLIYYVANGTAISPVEPGAHDLGLVKQPIRIMSAPGNQNLIPDASFETGPWQKNVGDCNNYGGNPLISMQITNQDRTLGTHSLLLTAFKHTACTQSPSFAVKPLTEYAFGLDYKTLSTQEADYELEFNDPAHTNTRVRIPANGDQSWHAYRTSFTTPQGATQANVVLMGIPDDLHQANATTLYDNLLMSELSPVIDPNLNLTPQYQQVALTGNTSPTRISLMDSNITNTNLIQNPTFSQGPWNKTVGDCDNYDSSPNIGMSLDTTDHSVGKQSIQLSSKHHTACTSARPIRISENKTYLLGFDYQSPNATNASYYIQFNDPNRTSLSDNLPTQSSTWQHFSKAITAPPGATNLTITVRAIPVDYSSTAAIDRYDNFSLVEIPNASGQFFVVQNASTPSIAPHITFDATSQSRKFIHIKQAKGRFYLAMSETYQPGWRLEVNNHQSNSGLNAWLPWAKPIAIPDADHFELNKFENGWYIDINRICHQPNTCKANSNGSYDIEMIAEFTPQRWLYLGGLISAATIAICLVILTLNAMRRWIKISRQEPSEERNARSRKKKVHLG